MVYSGKFCTYYLELAQTPCSQSNFAGGDVRFSTEYETLEFELGKAQSIHGACQPDWQKVVATAEVLLREQSKDLRVAVWLTWALHQRESFPGLLAGLKLLRHLCERHWPEVYPRKTRTRSDRERFHWRLAQARLCVQAGKHELAKIQLDHLDLELQRTGLERWEPELAVHVTQLLHRCCDLLPQSHAVRERKEDTHRRLCLFDLEAVLE